MPIYPISGLVPDAASIHATPLKNHFAILWVTATGPNRNHSVQYTHGFQDHLSSSLHSRQHFGEFAMSASTSQE